ncbi:MAG TPA: glycosyltransferase family 2 protein [Stellaceae bacterium]|nr:glycosyltransferase family 2 protein [Stellaceae bacterium]
MELSVVIPVRNEAPNIVPLVAELRAALEGSCDFEIIYVDDGSSDGTAAAIAALARSWPRLRLLRHARSFGQSAAIMSGVKAARGHFIATLDGDGQNDPADVPRLYEMARAAPRAPALLVAGLRAKRRDTVTRRLASRIANGVRAGLLGDATVDTGCGLKVLRREAFLELPFFDHCHRFLPALVLRGGGRVVSVPVNHRPRAGGRSNYGVFDRLWVGIVDLLGMMWLMRRAIRPEIVAEESAAEPESAPARVATRVP